MRVVSLIKAPTEVLVHRVDLGGKGVSLEPVQVEPRGLVAAVNGLAVAQTLDTGNLVLEIAGGDDGETYAVRCAAEFLDGGLVDIPLELAVIDGDWTMPGGGAPMLSVGSFVSKVGRDEVLRLTDTGDGRIDKGLVVGALTDAQAQAEAHLAGRYSLPFAAVPVLVEGIIADLARAALYVDELPDNVAERRRIALRNLDAIRKGDLRLGAEALAQTAAPTDPVRFDPGERAYPDGLKDYAWR